MQWFAALVSIFNVVGSQNAGDTKRRLVVSDKSKSGKDSGKDSGKEDCCVTIVDTEKSDGVCWTHRPGETWTDHGKKDEAACAELCGEYPECESGNKDGKLSGSKGAIGELLTNELEYTWNGAVRLRNYVEVQCHAPHNE